MIKLNKFIEATILFSALNLCWHGTSLAVEQGNNAMEAEPSPRGMKRSAIQGELSIDDKDLLIGAPMELIRYIVDNFDLNKDQNTLLSLMITCTKFHYAIKAKYQEANEVEKHCSWQCNPCLYPSTLYVFNNRMLTMLGQYSNIMCYMSFDADRIRFNILCDQLVNSPFFSDDSIPVKFVNLVRLTVSCKFPTFTESTQVIYSQMMLNTNVEECLTELLTITAQVPIPQNEGALLLQLLRNACGKGNDDFTMNLYSKLNGSLMKVNNLELIALKSKPYLSEPGLSNNPHYAETWIRIIDLEPAENTFQLSMAVRSLCFFGNACEDSATKAARFTKAAEYYEKLFKIISATGKKPTIYDINNAASAYYYAGHYSADPNIKAEKFARSKHYREKEIELKKVAGHIRTANESRSAITNLFKWHCY